MAAIDALFECFDDVAGARDSVEDEKEKYLNEVKNSDVRTASVLRRDDCVHEVTHSASDREPELIDGAEPAKAYAFELDTFQRQSILCIDNEQSVLVSAHTSAGKTVVAEYAIAKSLKNKQRVIYTTPIKALSNQKYRELLHEFGDVGLLTGDVSIDNESSCLVMTTEILRQMLYKGSEIVKEVQWVIFDEIHYMRDKARGIVWEETIILLPHNVRYVFLSATIPNARQFAEWITFLHHQPCNVVYTEYRPTPLQKYIYAKNDRLIRISDEKNAFDENNFAAAFAAASGKSAPKTDLATLVQTLVKNRWTPILFFCFQKVSCETNAINVAKFCFNTEREQQLVAEVFNNAIGVLEPAERELPHVKKVLPLLQRGIAFHHSGLLPLIKETIEILFGEGLIKVLFATETFAMGLNMPAKTVVFTNLKKYDGIKERFITSGEFIQMSGRAGRRGIDDKGIVIVTIEDKEDRAEIDEYADNLKAILLGKADPLTSAYHITYSMILNLLRLEEINPKYLIYKSFLYFQNQATITNKFLSIAEKEKQCNDLKELDDPRTKLLCQVKELYRQISSYIMIPRNVCHFLVPGCFLKIMIGNDMYEWGIYISANFIRKRKSDVRSNQNLPFDAENIESLNVILHVENFDKASRPKGFVPKPHSGRHKELGIIDIFAVQMNTICKISSEAINIKKIVRYPTEVNKRRGAYMKAMKNMEEKYESCDRIPYFHPVSDMRIRDPLIVSKVKEVELLEEELFKLNKNRNKIWNEERGKGVGEYQKKLKLLGEIEEEKREIKRLGGFMDEELRQKKNVLRRLNYCDHMDTITLKGRVACEFSSYELILSEMLLSGVLNTIPVDLCVGILGCLLCKEVPTGLTLDKLTQDTLNTVDNLLKGIERVLIDEGLLEKGCRMHQFQPTLVNIIKAWCEGTPFEDICGMTSVYEGTLIRYMRSVDEILRMLHKAAKNIGNTDLEVKFSNGIKRLRKGIVFASSLYL